VTIRLLPDSATTSRRISSVIVATSETSRDRRRPSATPRDAVRPIAGTKSTKCAEFVPILDLLPDKSQLNVYVGEHAVRPPEAPTLRLRRRHSTCPCDIRVLIRAAPSSKETGEIYRDGPRAAPAASPRRARGGHEERRTQTERDHSGKDNRDGEDEPRAENARRDLGDKKRRDHRPHTGSIRSCERSQLP
jgi:hypothetical protein